jgi:hypothetical protein
MTDRYDQQQGLKAPLKAGDIQIDEIVIIDRSGSELNVQAMLIELNIFEDIFSNCLYGNIVLSDGQGLIEKLPIIGDEYLRIKCGTPGFEEADIFYRTFRIYGIGDRNVVTSDRLQQYTLHFCSPEAITDTLLPFSRTYSGQVDKVVSDIFQEYLQLPRNLFGAVDNNPVKESEDTTNLLVLGKTGNSIKFTSPMWTPLESINWLASKSVPDKGRGSNFLLFETNKQFVFGSVEQLIEIQLNANTIMEHYIYTPANVMDDGRDTNFLYTRPQLDKAYRIVESFSIENNFNTLENLQNGYYANKLFKFDVIKKDYTTHDFDYVAQFEDYKHIETIEGRQGGPFFSRTTLRNPDTKMMFYPSHPGLYNGAKNNASDLVDKTMQNRISLLNDLNNYKINVTVNGRSDMEVGSIVRFDFPSITPKDSSTMESDGTDRYLSGLYLVTAIRHKITPIKHMMLMELVKDSVKTSLESA